MRCASCGGDNPERAKFCVECVAPLLRRCPQCGTENPPQAKFCAECATPLTTQPPLQVPSSAFQVPSSPQSPTPNTQHPSGERRQLTVMFCDLVGSTALSVQLDPEDLRTVIHTYQETCAAVLQQHEGYVAQYLGDGLLIYFGYPTAHEDDVRRAVRAGLEIVAALQNAEGSNPRLPSNQHDALESAAERRMKVGRSFKAGLQVRIDIHTGLVVVGGMGAGGSGQNGGAVVRGRAVSVER